jgi:hypothetical protein
MAYALVGIPLGLVMFQSIGERLNNFSSFVIRNVKRVLKYDSIEASETNLILVVTVSTFIPFYKNKILQNVDIFCFFCFCHILGNHDDYDIGWSGGLFQIRRMDLF